MIGSCPDAVDSQQGQESLKKGTLEFPVLACHDGRGASLAGDPDGNGRRPGSKAASNDQPLHFQTRNKVVCTSLPCCSISCDTSRDHLAASVASGWTECRRMKILRTVSQIRAETLHSHKQPHNLFLKGAGSTTSNRRRGRQSAVRDSGNGRRRVLNGPIHELGESIVRESFRASQDHAYLLQEPLKGQFT